MLAVTLSWCLCSTSLCAGSHLSETINKYTFYLANFEDFEYSWENPCGVFVCLFYFFPFFKFLFCFVFKFKDTQESLNITEHNGNPSPLLLKPATLQSQGGHDDEKPLGKYRIPY